MENENNFLRDFGEEGGMHAPPRAPRDAISDTKKLREDSRHMTMIFNIGKIMIIL